jgi:hypothetical protein
MYSADGTDGIAVEMVMSAGIESAPAEYPNEENGALYAARAPRRVDSAMKERRRVW